MDRITSCGIDPVLRRIVFAPRSTGITSAKESPSACWRTYTSARMRSSASGAWPTSSSLGTTPTFWSGTRRASSPEPADLA